MALANACADVGTQVDNVALWKRLSRVRRTSSARSSSRRPKSPCTPRGDVGRDLRPWGTGRSVPLVADKDKKQEIIERTYVLDASIPPVRVREQTGYDLDKKMWDSGLGLSVWLVAFLRAMATSKQQLAQRVQEYPTRTECRVLEFCAGTGFVSLMLYALLVSTMPASRAQIIATDLPSAIPLIEHNIAIVKSKAPSDAQCSLVGGVLDWDDPELPPYARDPDIPVMALPTTRRHSRRCSRLLGIYDRDCCCWDTSSGILLSGWTRCMELAGPGRDMGLRRSTRCSKGTMAGIVASSLFRKAFKLFIFVNLCLHGVGLARTGFVSRLRG